MKFKNQLASGVMTLILFGSTLLAADPAVTAQGAAIPLTATGEFYQGPVWSPNSNSNNLIAVSTSNYRGIYLVTFPDGDIRELSAADAVGFGMQWSHDGNWIAGRPARFENRRRYNAVAAFEISSGQEVLISDYNTRMPGTPVWTADDQFVYLNGSDHFQLFPTMTSPRTNVPHPTGQVNYVMRDVIQYRNLLSDMNSVINTVPGRVMNLAQSPDGSKVAFEIIGEHLWITDADGANPIDLDRGNNPAWSQDGTKLAFTVATDDGHELTSADIFAVNADGTGKVNLTNSSDRLEMHPTWSPDGQWIAFDTANQGQIFVLEVR